MSRLTDNKNRFGPPFGVVPHSECAHLNNGSFCNSQNYSHCPSSASFNRGGYCDEVEQCAMLPSCPPQCPQWPPLPEPQPQPQLYNYNPPHRAPSCPDCIQPRPAFDQVQSYPALVLPPLPQVSFVPAGFVPMPMPSFQPYTSTTTTTTQIIHEGIDNNNPQGSAGVPTLYVTQRSVVSTSDGTFQTSETTVTSVPLQTIDVFIPTVFPTQQGGWPVPVFAAPPAFDPVSMEDEFEEKLLDNSYFDTVPETRPASKEAIAAIEIAKIGKKDLEQLDLCAICQSAFKPGERAMLLKCVHYFHPDCLLPWLQRVNTCPMCRHEVLGPNEQSFL